MKPLEFNMNVGRTHDITPLKQAEEARPMVEQQQIFHSNEKAADMKQEQVYQKKDEDMDSEYDASKHGNGAEYQGNRNKKNKKESDEDGKVVIKSRASFDVKI